MIKILDKYTSFSEEERLLIGQYCYHKLAQHSNSFYEILAIEHLTGNKNSLSNNERF